MSELNRIMQRVQESPYTLHLLNGVMLVLLTWSLAQWTWMITGYRGTALSPVASITGRAAPAYSYNIDELTNIHLFGEANTQAPIAHEDLPISSLNLKLTGIVASDRGGFALISVNGQPQAPFYVGETIINNAVLDTVLTDRVILLRGAVKESLMLSEDFSPASMSDSSGTVYRPQMQPGRAGSIDKPPVTRVARNHYALPRNSVAQQLAKPDFLRQALIVPYGKGGFIVRNIKAGSLYQDLGLERNDIIKKVNGKPVNNMNDVMGLYKQLENIDTLSQVRIEVLRNGRPQTLEYTLN